MGKRLWATKESVMNEAKKYTSRSEFERNSCGAYSAAHRYGWIEEMYWLPNKNAKGFKRPKRKWVSKEIVFEELRLFFFAAKL